MDRTLSSSLRQFRTACPYLARTPTSTLRKLSTACLQGGSTTRLRVRAEQCPVMSDALNQNSNSLLLAVTDNKASPSAFNSLASVFSSSNGNLPFSTGGDSSSNFFNHQKRSFSTSNKSATTAASSCPFSNVGGQQTRSYVTPSQKVEASVVFDHSINPHGAQSGMTDLSKCPFASQAAAAAKQADGLVAQGRAPHRVSSIKKKFTPQVSHLAFEIGIRWMMYRGVGVEGTSAKRESGCIFSWR